MDHREERYEQERRGGGGGGVPCRGCYERKCPETRLVSCEQPNLDPPFGLVEFAGMYYIKWGYYYVRGEGM